MSEDPRLLMCPENLRDGMALGPIFYTIAPEQIDAFSRALGGDHPATSDGLALAPPTMRLRDYALLIAAHFYGGSGGVHAKHRCEFHQPLRAGQSVRVDGRITRTWRKRGKFYFELEYETRDGVSGGLLTRQAITSVLLNKGEMA